LYTKKEFFCKGFVNISPTSIIVKNGKCSEEFALLVLFREVARQYLELLTDGEEQYIGTIFEGQTTNYQPTPHNIPEALSHQLQLTKT
jgi:hypothetical protein